MLRVGPPPPGVPPGPTPPPGLPPDLPPELAGGPPPPPEPPKGLKGESGMMTFQKVKPEIAVYMPSHMGPFICSNCHYFEEDGSCTLVDGPIDPEGVCHLFTPNEGGGKDEAKPKSETEDSPIPPGPPEEGPPPIPGV